MTETSTRFALPLLQAGQAQKEIFHNEALTLIDAMLHPVAQGIGDNDPPISPAEGECRIVGPVPTGAWAGHAEALACNTTGGWRFVSAVPGMAVWLAVPALWVWYDGNTWVPGAMPVSAIMVDGVQVLGSQQGAIAAPSGGAMIDLEARSAITDILETLRNHGLITT